MYITKHLQTYLQGLQTTYVCFKSFLLLREKEEKVQERPRILSNFDVSTKSDVSEGVRGKVRESLKVKAWKCLRKK